MSTDAIIRPGRPRMWADRRKERCSNRYGIIAARHQSHCQWPPCHASAAAVRSLTVRPGQDPNSADFKFGNKVLRSVTFLNLGNFLYLLCRLGPSKGRGHLFTDMFHSKCAYLCMIHVLAAWTGSNRLPLNHEGHATDLMGYKTDIVPLDLGTAEQRH